MGRGNGRRKYANLIFGCLGSSPFPQRAVSILPAALSQLSATVGACSEASLGPRNFCDVLTALSQRAPPEIPLLREASVVPRPSNVLPTQPLLRVSQISSMASIIYIPCNPGAGGWVGGRGSGLPGSWGLTISVERVPTLIPGSSADGIKAAVFWGGSLRVKVAFHSLSRGAGHILL